jgi:hypothetical protein
VIKLDIEGSELVFLRGATNVITRCRPLILGEFNSAYMPRFGHTFLDVGQWYKPWTTRSSPSVPRVSRWWSSQPWAAATSCWLPRRLDETLEVLGALVTG